jgi:O-antigen ligase
MTTKNRFFEFFRIGKRVLWALFFFTLPVTSFPFFPPGLGGKTLVQPLIIYPLILLVIFVTLPKLFTKPLPKTFLPLLAFIIIASISSTAALGAGIEPLRGVSLESRFIRNLLTLGIGTSIYFTTALLHDNWEDMRFSLHWLFAGFTIALLWGTLQIIYIINYNSEYFGLLNQLQSFFSTRKLFPTRISGLTFEPKWFAEQIVFLLLPWLLGSILSRYRIFKWNYKNITLEMLLIFWSIIVLIFTFSRSGIFILIMLLILSYIIFYTYTRKKSKQGIIETNRGKRLIKAISLFSSILLLLVIVGSQNTYFSRLWRYWTDAKSRNRSYLEYISVQQRFVYLETAYRVFESHPIMGVGLGNFAYYFDDMLPNRRWDAQKEIVRQLTPTEGRNQLITPKNFYGRLLSETGIVGIAGFTTFALAVLGCILYLWFSPNPVEKYWGLSGFIALVAFVFVAFSFDSFAYPNIWIVFGLITAAAHMDNRTGSTLTDQEEYFHEK